MKAKAFVAAVLVLAVAVGLQWASGLPFQRCPEEALFALFALIFSGLAYSYPGFHE